MPINTLTRSSFALVFILLAASASAQTTSTTLASIDEFTQVKAKGVTVWQLAIDNDSLLLNYDDGFYTAGNQIGQRWVLNQGAKSISYGWSLGQELYTASNTNLLPQQLSPTDRPYAAWLHAGVFREVETVTGEATKWSLDLGCMGPCAGGERSQKTLHRLLQQPLPQGWASQLRNEWGAVLGAEYSPGRVLPISNVDLTPRVKARLGNIFTDAALELKLRAGRILALPQQATSYGFLRTEAKVVGYNATIQGGYFANQKTGVTPKRWVGEIEAGYVWQGEEFGVNASVIRRSSEVKELSNAIAAQNFVRLLLEYRY
jgi:lipid A 3-O-deacylase